MTHPRLDWIRYTLLIVFIAAGILFDGPQMATASTWTNNAGDGQWFTAANWSGGIPNATDAVADFSTLALSSNVTITATGAVTVGKLFVGGSSFVSYAYTITNQMGLTFSVSSGSAVLTHGNNSYLDTISGSNITLSSPLAITNYSGLYALTLAAPISGNSTIFVAGGVGEVTLSATNSTFTNLITVGSGTLSFTSDNGDTVQGGLGPTNNAISMVAGAKLKFAPSWGYLSAGRTLTVNGPSSNTLSAYNGINALFTVDSLITGSGGVSFLPNSTGNGLFVANPSNNYTGGTYISFDPTWGLQVVTLSTNARVGSGAVWVSGYISSGCDALNLLGNSNLVYGSSTPYTYLPMNASSTAVEFFRGTVPVMGSLSGQAFVSLGGFFVGNCGGVAQAQPSTVQLTVGMDNANATLSGSINEVFGSTATTGTVVKAGSGNWYLTCGGSAYRGGLIITNGAVFANAGVFTASTYSAYTVLYSGKINSLPSTNGLTLGQLVTAPSGFTPSVIVAFNNATNISTTGDSGGAWAETFTFSKCGPTGVGPVTVATNATLGGSGGIWGAVTVNGGTIAPGADVGVGGTLTVNSNVVFNSGSKLQINVSSSASYGQLVVNGTLALTNTTISITGGTALYNGLAVPILTATNLVMNNVILTTPGYQINQVGTQLMLTAQIPAVANNGYALAGPHSVYLSGTLLSTGTAQTIWGVIYGTNDPGPTLSGWLGGGQHFIGGAGSTPNIVTNLIEQLQTGQTYYFRFWAQNANGLTVADPSISFTPVNALLNCMPINFPGYTNRAETLTNFPALVVLSNNMASGFTFASFISTNGWDLRFVTNLVSTNYLNYEIESWNTNAGQASYVWVQVPMIPGNGSGRIYAEWGDPNNSSQLPCTTNGSTWANGYVGVWHCGNGSVLSVNDSSSNRINGTLGGSPSASAANGVISGSASLNGTTSAITLPNTSGILDLNGSWMFSFWLKRIGAYPGTWPGVVGTTAWKTPTTGGWGICYYSGGIALVKQNQAVTMGITSASQYDHFAVSYNGTAWTAYQDGIATSNAPVAFGQDAHTTALMIGPSPDSVYGNFLMDELRVESVSRSTNWVWACYQNMVSNTAFNTYNGVTFSTLKDPPMSGTTVLFH